MLHLSLTANPHIELKLLGTWVIDYLNKGKMMVDRNLSVRLENQKPRYSHHPPPSADRGQPLYTYTSAPWPHHFNIIMTFLGKVNVGCTVCRFLFSWGYVGDFEGCCFMSTVELKIISIWGSYKCLVHRLREVCFLWLHTKTGGRWQ